MTLISRRLLLRLALPAVVIATAFTSTAPAHSYAATATVTPAAATSVTVMDWNIEGGNNAYLGERFTILENTIRKYNPDVLTLQEIHQAAGETVPHDGTTSPGINQIDQLVKDFPQFADTATEYHEVWSRGDKDGTGGSAGNLILSRFPLSQRYAVKLPNDPGNGLSCPTDVDHSGDGTGCPVNRSFAGAMAVVNGVDLRFYTSHFTAGLGQYPEHDRTAQTDSVITKLQSPPITSPFVFTGDLNYPQSDTNRAKFAGIGLSDAWTHSNNNTGDETITEQGGTATNGRIDNVWSSPGFDVGSIVRGDHPVDSAGTLVSDHWPLITTLTVHSPAISRAAGAADAATGWATVGLTATASTQLRTCDNVSDAYGVLSYLRNASTNAVLGTGHDDHYGDGCTSTTVPAVASTTPLNLQICRNNAGTATDCVTRSVPTG